MSCDGGEGGREWGLKCCPEQERQAEGTKADGRISAQQGAVVGSRSRGQLQLKGGTMRGCRKL